MTIASVLVQDPELIILDEPTAGQDFHHYTEIMEFLRGLNEKGVTAVSYTHLKIKGVIREILPMVLIMIGLLFLVTYVPDIIMFIPNNFM